MKKILLFGTLFLLVLMTPVFAAGSGEAQATPDKPVVFKGGVTGSPDWQYTLALNEWAQIVKEKTNGAILIEVFPAEQLGNERELIERTNLGVIDWCLVGAGGGGEFAPAFAMFENAFTFKSLEHFENVAFNREFRDELAQLLEESSNMTFLGLSLNGVRNVLSIKPFKTPAQANGLRLRVPDVATFKIVARAIGASATPLPFGEVYMAIQQGVADAVEGSPENMVNMKFYEVAKNYVLTEHMIQGLGHFFNKSAFNKISKAQQEILIDSAFDVMHKYFVASAEVQDSYMARLKDEYKINIIELTDAEKEVFQNRAVEELNKEYIPSWGNLWEKFLDLAN